MNEESTANNRSVSLSLADTVECTASSSSFLSSRSSSNSSNSYSFLSSTLLQFDGHFIPEHTHSLPVPHRSPRQSTHVTYPTETPSVPPPLAGSVPPAPLAAPFPPPTSAAPFAPLISVAPLPARVDSPHPADTLLAGSCKRAIPSFERSFERTQKFHRLSESLGETLSDSDLSCASGDSTPGANSSTMHNSQSNRLDDAAAQPEWFRLFLREYRANQEEYRTDQTRIVGEFQRLNARMDGIDAHIKVINERLEKFGSEVQEVRAKLDKVVKKQNEMENAMLPSIPDFRRTNVDTLEVKITGIPAEIAQVCDHKNITAMILTALQQKNLEYQVAMLRPWNPHPRQSSAADSNNASFCALVIKFFNATARDIFLSNVSKLKNLDAAAIFPGYTTSKAHIVASALLPGPLHRRVSRARRIAHERGYPPPITRDLTLFMRNSRESEPFPILSDAQLEALPVLTSGSSNK